MAGTMGPPHSADSNGRPIIKDLFLDRQVVNRLDLVFVVEIRCGGLTANQYESPELERLIKHTTGAIKVVVFAHDVRSILKARAGEQGVREPVAPVHHD
jgi:hypothetical protein